MKFDFTLGNFIEKVSNKLIKIEDVFFKYCWLNLK
jgi:hypothetical protein